MDVHLHGLVMTKSALLARAQALSMLGQLNILSDPRVRWRHTPKGHLVLSLHTFVLLLARKWQT